MGPTLKCLHEVFNENNRQIPTYQSNHTKDSNMVEVVKLQEQVVDLRYQKMPDFVQLSISDKEAFNGVYNDNFVYSSTTWNNLHKVTNRFGYSSMVFDGGKRLKANVVGYGNVLIFDIDDHYTIEEVLKKLDGVKSLITTTKSHQKPKSNKEPCDRFRVLVLLDRTMNNNCTPSQYTELMKIVLEWLGLDVQKVDKACLGNDRFYTPNVIDQQHWYVDGTPISMRKMWNRAVMLQKREDQRREQQRLIQSQRTYTDTTLQDASDALQRIDPDISYEDWFRIGAALKSEFGDIAFQLFCDWSARGSKFDGEKKLLHKWNSFAIGKVGIATLFYMAKGA